MTRVLITGSRHWDCHELAARVVGKLKAKYPEGLVIVHGNAGGVDSAFRKACQAAGVEHEAHPAEWHKYGRRAGPLRNQAMVDAGAAFAIACHDDLDNSKGTGDCVTRCLAAGVPVYHYSDEGQDKPVRVKDFSA